LAFSFYHYNIEASFLNLSRNSDIDKIDDEEKSRADFLCVCDMDVMKFTKIAVASVEDTEKNLKFLS